MKRMFKVFAFPPGHVHGTNPHDSIQTKEIILEADIVVVRGFS